MEINKAGKNTRGHILTHNGKKIASAEYRSGFAFGDNKPRVQVIFLDVKIADMVFLPTVQLNQAEAAEVEISLLSDPEQLAAARVLAEANTAKSGQKSARIF